VVHHIEVISIELEETILRASAHKLGDYTYNGRKETRYFRVLGIVTGLENPQVGLGYRYGLGLSKPRHTRTRSTG